MSAIVLGTLISIRGIVLAPVTAHQIMDPMTDDSSIRIWPPHQNFACCLIYILVVDFWTDGRVSKVMPISQYTHKIRVLFVSYHEYNCWCVTDGDAKCGTSPPTPSRPLFVQQLACSSSNNLYICIDAIWLRKVQSPTLILLLCRKWISIYIIEIVCEIKNSMVFVHEVYQCCEDLLTESTQQGFWVCPYPTSAGNPTAWPVMRERTTRQLYKKTFTSWLTTMIWYTLVIYTGETPPQLLGVTVTRMEIANQRICQQGITEPPSLSLCYPSMSIRRGAYMLYGLDSMYLWI